MAISLHKDIYSRKVLACLLILTSILLSNSCLSQSIANTSAGSDFWCGFPEEIDQNNVTYNIYITCLKATSGTVSVPGAPFSQHFTVAPNVLTTVTIPHVDVVNTTTDGLKPMAIHVTSDSGVFSVYSQGLVGVRSAASIALPTPFLGTSYYVLSWYETPASGGSSELMVVGTGVPVTVTITPSVTVGTHPHGQPYNITIPANDVYQLQCNDSDLTGTTIVATNGTDIFAVLGGNDITSVAEPRTQNGDVDPLYSAMYPTKNWGKSYVFIPTPLINEDVCRVLAAQAGTQVYFNNQLQVTLGAGQYYDTVMTTPCYINATAPVEVGKFMYTGTLDAGHHFPPPNGSWGDPEEIVQGANEQMFVDSISFYATTADALDSNWATIVTRTSDTSRITFDGIGLSGHFHVLAANTNYSYTIKSITQGAYVVEDTGGCGVLVYVTGIGSAISYGYTAGIAVSAVRPTPKLNACLGDSIQILSGIPGSPSSYAWSFGDGGTSNVANPWHKYALTGNYLARLIANYPCFVDTVYDSITVNPVVGVTTITPPSDTLCNGSSVSLTVSGASAYSWIPSAGLSCSNCLTPTASPTVTTTYTVVSTSGCTNKDSITIKVNPDSAVSITPPLDTICTGGQKTLTASGSSNYVWSPNTDLTCTSCASTTANPTAPTNYKVVATNSFGCKDSASVTLWVKSKPIPIITAVPPNDSICAGDSAHLSGSGGGSYLWTPGNFTQSNIWVKTNNTYSLAVSNGTCSTDTSVTITVIPSPLVTIVPPTSTICFGSNITLTASGGGTYKWSNNSTNSFITVDPTSNSTYKVAVITNGCKDSASTTVTVDVPVLNACCDDSIKFGDTVHLNANGATSYTWSPAAGLSCTNCPDPIASPTVNTTYTVTSEDANGCSQDRIITIDVKVQCADFNVPNVFTPNNDGINDDLVITVLNSTSYSITIFDRWGKQVYSSSNIAEYWNGRVNNTDNLAPDGTYYYSIKATCGTTEYTKKGFIELVK